MAERDAKGRFVEGNQAHKGGSQRKRIVKAASLEKLMEANEILDEELGDLKAEMDNPKNSKWRHLCLHALNQKNFKFFQWCLEMMLGRPSQNVEMNNPTSQDNEKLKEEIAILREQLAEKHKKEY